MMKPSQSHPSTRLPKQRTLSSIRISNPTQNRKRVLRASKSAPKILQPIVNTSPSKIKSTQILPPPLSVFRGQSWKYLPLPNDRAHQKKLLRTKVGSFSALTLPRSSQVDECFDAEVIPTPTECVSTRLSSMIQRTSFPPSIFDDVYTGGTTAEPRVSVIAHSDEPTSTMTKARTEKFELISPDAVSILTEPLVDTAEKKKNHKCLLRHFQKGVAHYHNRRYDLAIDAFKESMGVYSSLSVGSNNNNHHHHRDRDRDRTTSSSSNPPMMMMHQGACYFNIALSQYNRLKRSTRANTVKSVDWITEAVKCSTRSCPSLLNLKQRLVQVQFRSMLYRELNQYDLAARDCESMVQIQRQLLALENDESLSCSSTKDDDNDLSSVHDLRRSLLSGSPQSQGKNGFDKALVTRPESRTSAQIELLVEHSKESAFLSRLDSTLLSLLWKHFCLENVAQGSRFQVQSQGYGFYYIWSGSLKVEMMHHEGCLICPYASLQPGDVFCPHSILDTEHWPHCQFFPENTAVQILALPRDVYEDSALERHIRDASQARFQFLSTCALFRHWTLNQQRALARVSTLVDFPTNCVMVRQAQVMTCVHVVVSGFASVLRTVSPEALALRLGVLSAGDVFGKELLLLKQLVDEHHHHHQPPAFRTTIVSQTRFCVLRIQPQYLTLLSSDDDDCCGLADPLLPIIIGSLSLPDLNRLSVHVAPDPLLIQMLETKCAQQKLIRDFAARPKNPKA